MDKEPSCYFCGKKLNSEEAEDAYCHGCGEHVCEDCEKNHMLMGEHDVSEHAEAG